MENTGTMRNAIKGLQEKVTLVEGIVWAKYFAKEKEKFDKALQILEKYKSTVLSTLPEEYEPSYNQKFINVLRNFPIDKIRSDLDVMNVIDELALCHVEFTNLFLMEIVDGDHLTVQEKILFLEDFLKTTELLSLTLNVSLYHIYIVALSYAERSLVQLNKIQKLYNHIWNTINSDDLYYWPENQGSATAFFDKLAELKLIKPQKDNTQSLLEDYSKENRIEWIGENRQLICLLFLLYEGREFKGEKIHDIACKIFFSTNGLNPRSLNNQLIKFIEPKFNKIIDAAIDYPLQKIIDIFKKS